MALVSFQLIFVLLLVISCVFVEQTGSNAGRRRRQVLDGTVRNAGVQAQKPGEKMNTQFNPSNNPNVVMSNDPRSNTNNALGPAQSPPVRSRGYYNSPEYQRSPFAAEKPQGWFGTNQPNWLSNREMEIDKNIPDGSKSGSPMSLQGKQTNTINSNAGIVEMRKIAQQYASKGDKAFKFGKHETMEGRGAVCENHDNFGGFTFGKFSCPFPPATGMNQRNQYCCGPQNYQFCCNAEEFSQTRRGSHTGHLFETDGRRVRAHRPSATRTILATVIPIVAFLALTAVAFVVYQRYRKGRQQKTITGKPTGATRLPDTYSVVPQEPPEAEQPVLTQNEQTNARA